MLDTVSLDLVWASNENFLFFLQRIQIFSLKKKIIFYTTFFISDFKVEFVDKITSNNFMKF